MRPNRQDQETAARYRRQANGGNNAARIAAALVVAVGVVVITLVLANTYDFSSAAQPPQDKPVQTALNARDITSAGLSGQGDKNAPVSGSGGANGLTTGTSSETSTGLPGGQVGDSGSTASSVNADSPEGTGRLGLTGDGGSDASSRADQVVNAVNVACTIHGRVTDDWGSPIVGVVVQAVAADGNIVETTTDSRGRYSLPGAMPELDPNADPAAGPDVVEVSVVLSHGTGSGSSFAVMYGDAVIALTVSVSRPAASSPDGCEQNFDTWDIRDGMVATPIKTLLWPDAAAIYQHTQHAEELALSLGADLDAAATLHVQAWCDDPGLGCDGSRTGAFFVAAGELAEGSPPIIAITPERSSANTAGVPLNREYHEYGHYFLWLQTGETFELPAGDSNHGGYYRNTSTRDSFVEGFAEFYSMMVSRHVDGNTRSEIYTIGADYDLEANRMPWEAEGWWEEFTIAGLLLDLVDSDADYAERSAGPIGVNVLEVSVDTGPSGTIVLGKVVNTSPLVVRNADVTIRYMNNNGEVVGTQVTRVIPEIIAPTREGTFYAAPPAGLAVTTATARTGGIARADDDEVHMDLQQLIGIITGYQRTGASTNGAGNIGVSNVAELYDALVGGNESLGTAAIGASLSQINEIFINHGFFADLDGDRKYDPEVDGEIGHSSHPVTRVGSTSYPAIIPREDPDAYDGAFVTLKTGDESVDAVVQISMPADGGSGSYAYVTTLNGTGRVELAVPAPGQGAEVTIITAARDFKPVIAFRIDADVFHEKVANGTINELQITPVELEPGTSLAIAGGDGPSMQFNIIVAGVVAALLVLTSLVVINRRWGRA